MPHRKRRFIWLIPKTSAKPSNCPTCCRRPSTLRSFPNDTEIAAQIRSLIGRRRPETAIILGSGLGALADEITDSVSISYADIDGFPQSTVQGHGGKLIIGQLKDKEILCMQGRFHLYEGHKPQVINTVIKAFQLLGIKI